MDGYHYSRQELKHLSEIKSNGDASNKFSYDNLISRRGSPWTFDARKLVADLVNGKKNKKGMFPKYERTLSDPVQNAIEVYLFTSCLSFFYLSQVFCSWSLVTKLYWWKVILHFQMLFLSQFLSTCYLFYFLCRQLSSWFRWSRVGGPARCVWRYLVHHLREQGGTDRSTDQTASRDLVKRKD